MRAELCAKRDAFFGKINKRPAVMGILNVTPVSFSDGGRFAPAAPALRQAEKMAAEGCDIMDIGGESSRAGAVAITESEELARIEAILPELVGVLDVPLSIDTYKTNVATRALELGAVLVNDVWGLQKDPAMADAVAAAGAAVVIMHNRAEKDPSIDIIADIRRFFTHSLALVERAGIPRSRIILDPRIAFGKSARQNIEAIARIGELMEFGCPILVGVSRKKFLGSLSANSAEGQLIGTIAASVAARAAGASLFRVHDVAEHVASLEVFDTRLCGRRNRDDERHGTRSATGHLPPRHRNGLVITSLARAS